MEVLTGCRPLMQVIYQTWWSDAAATYTGLLNRPKHSIFYCSRVTKRAMEKVRNLAGIGSGNWTGGFYDLTKKGEKQLLITIGRVTRSRRQNSWLSKSMV